MQSGIALAASPVSAAMAAMLTLTDVAPYDLGLGQILAITLPACVIGIIVTSLVVNRMWKDLDDDPEVQARIESGELAPPEAAAADGQSAAAQLTYTKRGRTQPSPSSSVSSPSSCSDSSPTCGPRGRSTAKRYRST